jgi:pimeloyl-ACP methyl ester carboxylesterase
MTGRTAVAAPWRVPPGLVTASVDGYPLAYRDVGRGEPVLLVHGSLTDYRSWDAQVDALAARYRVIVPSLRHCYPERWRGADDDYRLARHAADLAALLDALALDRAHVVGHSRGGAVALALLGIARQRLRSLTLADPRGLESLLPGGDREETEIGQAFARLRRALEAGDIEGGARAFVDGLGGQGAWDARTAAQRQMFLDNIGTACDPGELPDLASLDLARLDVPTLLLTGERSPRRYHRMFDALRALAPHIAAPIVVAGAAHAMQRENPAAFNGALLAFLDGLTRGAD